MFDTLTMNGGKEKRNAWLCYLKKKKKENEKN